MQDRASKFKGLLWLLGACVIGVLFACGLSPLAHAIPWSWEKHLGEMVNPPGQECEPTPAARSLLNKLVARIYPTEAQDRDFSIDVHVSRDSVVNAYAMLGGSITVNSGLLKQAQSPEELAGVLAHEIGHVEHRDIMKGTLVRLVTSEGLHVILGDHSSAASWANFFLHMGFTRTQEAQADEAGLIRLQAAHVSNLGFRSFFERMEESASAPQFLSDHPSNDERIAMVASFPNDNVTPIMTVQEWGVLKQYCSAPSVHN